MEEEEEGSNYCMAEDGSNSRVIEELSDHENDRQSGFNFSLFDTECSRNPNFDSEMVERIDLCSMQRLFWGNSSSQINQSRDGAGITDDAKFSCLDSGTCSGFEANKPQNPKKRKKKNITTQVKRRPNLRLKKHRPRIFDATRPKKTPKAKNKSKSSQKRSKDIKKTKVERKRRDRKKPTMSKSTELPTPEHSIPIPQYKVYTPSCKRALVYDQDSRPTQDFSDKIEVPQFKVYTRLCKRTLVYDQDFEQDSRPSQDFSDKIDIPQCKVYTRLCKRALVYDQDVGHDARPSQDFSNKIDIPQCKVYTRLCKRALVYDQDIGQDARPSQDFSDKIEVPQCKVYTRRKKMFKAFNFNINLEVEDFDSCVELRKILWEVRTLKLEDFPVASKKVRMGRRKATANPYFLEASKKHMLPTVKQFTAAIMEPKYFSCVLALQPKVISRKKRSKRLKTLAAAMGRTDFPRRIRSQRYYTRRRAFAISSSDFGFKSNPNETEIKKIPLLIDLRASPEPFEEALGFDSIPNVAESSEVEPQNDRIWDGFHRMQLWLVDDLIKRLKNLSIHNVCKEIVVHDQSSRGAFVPLKIKRKKQKPPEVISDEYTMRDLMLLKKEDRSEPAKEQYWEEQRSIFCGRVDLFIKRMHLIQGDRRFSRWKGSVVDSVVGVFLTQNVSDHLSSNAFMMLVAKFPKHPIKSKDDNHQGDDEVRLSQESVGSNAETEGPPTADESSQPRANKIEKNTSDRFREEEKNETTTIGDVVPDFEGTTLTFDAFGECEVFPGCTLKDLKEDEVVNTKTEYGAKDNMNGGKKYDKERFISKSGKTYKGEKGEPKKKQEISINWDDLRKKYSTRSRDEAVDTDDAVDWEAVRRARAEDIAEIIKQRGMNNILADKIKDFLDRIVKDHGSIDLEWLRNVPPEKAKEFLLSIQGIGLKSVECIRLLSLHQHAFPVDTNVGRIAVRLGWVPLQTLPDGLHLHLLEEYPVMNTIQEYLWPRLTALDQPTLYELHYQMITFGKVFCTKLKPKCNVCPMKGSCKHYASEFASSRLRLPSPQEKGIVKTKAEYTANQDPNSHLAPWEVSGLDDNFLQPRHESQICEPIIEIPASPEPNWEIPEVDIEDICLNTDQEQEIDELFWDLRAEAILKLSANSEDPPRASGLEISVPKEFIASKAIALAPEADSFPALKLKSFGRLHTEHEVYVLPDNHSLLAGFRKREPDDPCPYLFSIWMTDETTNINEEPNDQTVLGTILIPCRTANEGRFPLSGTYFQVNEVFADHETSENPIRVSREELWFLPTRRVYCAASGRSIFTDMLLMEIHHCFWNGFICVRGFDRKTREPLDLQSRFHIPKTRSGKPKDENGGGKRKGSGRPENENGSKTRSKGTKKGK